MNNDLFPTWRGFWRMPTVSFPSFLDDIEDMLPTANFINGLSVSEDDKNVYVEAAVPGLEPKDVEVTFDKDMLTIRGEKKKEEKGKKFHRKATSSFLYRISLDGTDVKDDPTAECKKGVMKVIFTKMPKTQPKRIAVK